MEKQKKRWRRERERERKGKEEELELAEGQGGLNYHCYYQGQEQRLHSPATANLIVKIKNRGCFRCSIPLVCYSYSNLYGCFWLLLKWWVCLSPPQLHTFEYSSTMLVLLLY